MADSYPRWSHFSTWKVLKSTAVHEKKCIALNPFMRKEKRWNQWANGQVKMLQKEIEKPQKLEGRKW